MNILHAVKRAFLAMVVFVALTAGALQPAHALSGGALNRDANEALQRLTATNPSAAAIARVAKAVLIFPNIVKAGFIFGGSYGEGLLREGNVVDSYYNSVSASWGLQAGAQSYGYAVFLMNQRAIDYIRQSHGWEIGTGPTVVVMSQGIAKNLSTSTLREDAYAFIFDQQGLMASLSIEGTKITRINNP